MRSSVRFGRPCRKQQRTTDGLSTVFVLKPPKLLVFVSGRFFSKIDGKTRACVRKLPAVSSCHRFDRGCNHCSERSFWHIERVLVTGASKPPCPTRASALFEKKVGETHAFLRGRFQDGNVPHVVVSFVDGELTQPRTGYVRFSTCLSLSDLADSFQVSSSRRRRLRHGLQHGRHILHVLRIVLLAPGVSSR